MNGGRDNASRVSVIRRIRHTNQIPLATILTKTSSSFNFGIGTCLITSGACAGNGQCRAMGDVAVRQTFSVIRPVDSAPCAFRPRRRSLVTHRKCELSAAPNAENDAEKAAPSETPKAAFAPMPTHFRDVGSQLAQELRVGGLDGHFRVCGWAWQGGDWRQRAGAKKSTRQATASRTRVIILQVQECH